MASSFVKTQLKTAREAIAAKNYEYAESTCIDVLENDPCNYNALVFRGIALLHLKRTAESIASYTAAIAIAPSQPLAYQGLVKLYTETSDLGALLSTIRSLLPIYIEAKDASKGLDCAQQQVELCIRINDKLQAIECLKCLLPGTPLAELSPKDLPSPIDIWHRILDLREKEDSETIAREVELRRMRLGSDPLPVIKATVEREVVLSSEIDSILNSILELETDSLRIAEYNSKLLTVLSTRLTHTSQSEKEIIRLKMDAIATTLVSSGAILPLAFTTLLEAENVPIGSRNESLVASAASLPDESGISTACKAYLAWKSGTDAAAILEILKTSISLTSESIFSCHLLIRVCLDQCEWESAISYCETCKTLMVKFTRDTGRDLSRVETEVNLMLGEAYIELGQRFLTLALSTFRSILETDHSNLSALIGLGVALSLMGKHNEAIRCFDKVLRIDPSNQRSRIEMGWVSFCQGDYQRALDQLLDAQTYGTSYLIKYRLAKTYWMLDEHFRTDKTYVHSLLIEAAKLNPRYSPSFTLLGLYYKEVESDRVRATKCFLKAISIDGKDEDAIKSLVFFWLEENNTNQANTILKDAAVNLPRSGWIWKQLGIISLSCKRPLDAIDQLQTALRIDAKDCVSWTSLGEAYLTQGKFMAAIKTLDRALELDPQAHVPKYLKATVYHKLGMYPEAIASFKATLAELEDSLLVDSKGSTETKHAEISKNILVPALNGLNEAFLLYSRDLYQDGAYGSCASHLLSAIETCTRSLVIAPQLGKTAKVLGDACLSLATLVPNLVNETHASAVNQFIELLPEIKHGVHGMCTLPFSNKIDKEAPIQRVLCGSVWAYHRAMMISSGLQLQSMLVAAYSHDLGVAYYHAHRFAAESLLLDESSQLLSLSIKCVQISIRINPDKDLYWNALGVYSSSVNPKICQHALIKAAEVNLTVRMNDSDLASQCFSRAQFVDPDWALSWFGQAYLAKLEGNKGALELLEHSYELSNALQLEILYSFGLECFQNLQSIPSALVVASHCLLKCVERFPADPAAYNVYGLILERQHQYEGAINAFSSAVGYIQENLNTHPDCTQQRLAYALENKARCECAARLFEEANVTYTELVGLNQSENAFTFVGQGIAAYFVGNLTEGLMAFERALDFCEGPSGDESVARLLKNDTMLLLSQVLYALGTDEHIDLAKQQLLQCISTDAQYVPAIIGLGVLGLVLQDWTLAQTAAAELIKLGPEVLGELDADVDWILSTLFIMQGQIKTARAFLSKAIHRYPWKAVRWAKLAELLYCYSPSQSDISSTMVESGLNIFTSASPDSFDLVSTMKIADMQRIQGLSLLSEGNTKMRRKSRSALCRAIRSSPSNPENWLALGLHQCAEVVSVRSCEIAGDESPIASLDLTTLGRLAESSLDLVEIKTDTAEIANWSHLLKTEMLVHQGYASHNSEGLISEAIQTIDAVISVSALEAVRNSGNVLLGRLLFRQNDMPAAEEAFKASLQFDSGHNMVSWEDLAVVYTANGKYPSAEFCHRQALTALDANPKSKIPILLRLAQHYLCLGNHANATECINEALKLDSLNLLSRFFQTLVMTYTTQAKGKLAKNLAILKESDGIDPGIMDWLSNKLSEPV
ncbi:hypothetical protein BASA83_013088 [Batrachochytrium salamandrivorans]|nr:hypothetical protein BASA83_013088 [Batrachochytrium salamandrivorans]